MIEKDIFCCEGFLVKGYSVFGSRKMYLDLFLNI